MEAQVASSNGRKPWHIPAAPVRKLVEEYIAKEQRRLGCGEDGVLDELSIAAGISDRTLYRIRTHQKSIDFDTADRLFCAMGNPVRCWRELLPDLYFGANLARLDEVRPCTTRRHGGGRKTTWSRHSAELLHQRGASYDEIASQLCAPRDQVAGYLRRNNLVGGDGHRGKRTWDYEEAFRLKYEEGWTAKQLAEKYGIQARTVETTLWRIRHGRQPLVRGGQCIDYTQLAEAA